MDSGTIDWSLIDRNYIGSTLNIRTSIGCPYRCSFCNHPVRAGIYDLSDIKSIGEELDRIKAVGITKNIIFVDDTLNVPRKRFKELCKLMIEREYNFNWFSYFRINEADEETIKLMKESGCTGLFLGIESGDNEILKNMNKNADTETYLENIKLLNKYDIFSFGNFVVGFPGETSESLERTVDFIKKSNLTFYKMNLWYADRSTPIFKQNDKWKISGDRFNWSHATFDHKKATEGILNIFLGVDNPIWIPTESFGFWSIAYLHGKGFALSEIKPMIINLNRMVQADLANDANAEVVKEECVSELKSLLAAHYNQV